MKGVVDLFVAKDKIAVFWFLVACATVIGSGWYLQKIIKDAKAQPYFVIMDGAGVYYLAPTLDFSQAVDIHAAQTRLAMETFFNRGPAESDSPQRIEKLFSKAVVEYMDEEYKKEAEYFNKQKIHQKVEIGDVKVLKTVGNGAVTSAEGQIIRVGIFNGEQVVESFTLTAKFAWVLNKDMRYNGMFPTVCTQMKYEMEKK